MESSTPVPEAARIITMALSMITISVLAFCLTRRIQGVRNWRKMAFTNWLIIAIYIDSFLFIFSTAILSKAFSVNQSVEVCGAAILLCISCYSSTKVLIYYFLVEKVYIIRSANNGITRKKDKLWLFNFFGVICPYIVLVTLNFIYRTAYLNKDGVCIIGMKRKTLVPLISFDCALNVYLTSLFIHPLRQSYSYQEKTSTLRIMVLRTFIGSVTTLVMSITNLSVLTGLNGEAGYLCLALCNVDILCSALVLHWATSVDRPSETPTAVYGEGTIGTVGTVRSRVRSQMPSSRYLELDDDKNINQLTTKISSEGNSGQVPVDVIEVKTQSVQVVHIDSPGSRVLDFETGMRWNKNDNGERMVHDSV